MVKCERFDRWTVFPGGKMPPFTAGKDACRHIFRQALTVGFPNHLEFFGKLEVFWQNKEMICQKWGSRPRLRLAFYSSE
jgi:hypothetical protein